ncbi:TPA: glycosyltransferase [Vibrio parahaemolyticus]|uniref:Glycosyl transferase family 1 domain-containing protein n=3 Tax=Vibrio parahaemolyticus TaxID=670 RepID=A0A7M1WIV3_VIBPH|nr:glycosyltransferase [Vibrio parahaemolyticus]QOS27047.1 hypothetical protein VP393_00026 [Vibrio parahaemolyticus]HCH5331440.1 glycosyltransferase [Vibrio parahaemolyticus]HCM1510541.1 glycosyltransferase [Vibrio parahaemolyticus]
MKKVLIHYPFIPSYRLPIFKKLSQSNDYGFTFLSDPSAKTDIKVTDIGELEILKTNYHPLKIKSSFFEVETGVIKHLVKYRKSHEVYICLGSPNILTSWLYTVLAKVLGYKVFFWTQGTNREEFGLKKILRKLYLSLPHGLMLYGDRAKKTLKNYGIKLPMKPIYNSLDFEAQSSLRDHVTSDELVKLKRKLFLDENAIVLTCMGRLHSKLKIDQAITFIANYNNSNSTNVKLQIIGDGPELNNLSLLAKELNVDAVFHGAIYDETTLCNLYLLSSGALICGTVGLAAIHALGYGVPVITHNSFSQHCPEVESVIEGKTGYFYKSDDYISFENSVNNLINCDSNIREFCIEEVENKWCPEVQSRRIHEALSQWI